MRLQIGDQLAQSFETLNSSEEDRAPRYKKGATPGCHLIGQGGDRNAADAPNGAKHDISTGNVSMRLFAQLKDSIDHAGNTFLAQPD